MSTNKGSDLFFSLIPGSEWNACIGRQGDEANYVDGYMEAALELASAVIDKGQYGKRDTLAMPILYNARHALELTLKFVINRLCEAGVDVVRPPRNHDIKEHWDCLVAAQIGDEDMRKHVASLGRFVLSLHNIDADGQQLRYAETQDGQPSLSGKAVCDLQLIRESLVLLSETLKAMKNRVIDFIYERRTGTFTAACSRSDLMQISRMLPPRKQWSEHSFDVAKAEVMRRFGIGSRKFSEALNVIKAHRQMGALVGYERAPAHLTAEHAVFVVDEWSPSHDDERAKIQMGAADRRRRERRSEHVCQAHHLRRIDTMSRDLLH